jgi:hypothetical protein
MLSEDEIWRAGLSMAPDGDVVARAACREEVDDQTEQVRYQVREVRLWEVPSAEPAGTIPVEPEGFLALEFSPDDETLAILGFDRDALILEHVGD